MNTKEIITLQFGNYSNYVGAHWWNLQEFSFNFNPDVQSEIDPGVFYREGINNMKQVTFSPRLLLVDLNGTLKHVTKTGSLYSDIESGSMNLNQQTPTKPLNDDAQNSIPWDSEKIDIIEDEKEDIHDFQVDLESNNSNINSNIYNFKDTVTSWTDYLYTKFHPRTIQILDNYMFSAEKEIIDTYSNGTNLWMSSIFQEDFVDNIRKYVEECNNCQGFQTLFDSANGFSGLANKCQEYLTDEYGKVNFAVPIFSPKNILFENADEKLSNAIKLVNIASTYSNLNENTNLFVPLSTQNNCWKHVAKKREFKCLDYDSQNLYQCSAILATYLETITLRYRFNNHSSHLYEFCTDLNNYGRKMAAAALSLPFVMNKDYDLIDTLNEIDYPLFTQLSPNCKIGTDYIVQSVCVRGIPKNRLKRPLQEAQKQMKMPAYKCNSVSEMFQLYFQCLNHASLAHVSASESPIKIQKPYPEEIFSPNLSIDGFQMDHIRSSEVSLKSFPSVASIQTSGDISNTLESLHREASRVKISKIHRFKETGMEADDYLEILENLLHFKDNYDDKLEL